MKKTASQLVALLLAIVLICGLLPVTAFADDAPMKIVVDSVNAQPGGEVQVAVKVENNPGIASMKLNIAFDDVLTLTAVEYNRTAWAGMFQDPQNFKNPVTLNWFDGTKNFTESAAVFATLTFRVADDAQEDTKANISVTFDPNDIYNIAETNVECSAVNGVVTVCSLVHGDINGDRLRNNKDITRLFQYLANWDVKVVEKALDTNNDKNVNNKDLTRLFQFLANWDVELWCDGVLLATEEACQHDLKTVNYKAPTCEEAGNLEYHYCTLCKKNFTNASAVQELANVVLPATGHTEVDMAPVDPTYEEPGSEGGKKCSVCGKVTVEPTVVPPLEKTTVNIEYHYEGKSPGAFLKSYVEENDISKFNPNETEYNTAKKGYELDPLTNVNAVPGYEFCGWVDGYGNSVTSIAKGEEKNMILYAKWQIQTYWVTFDCGENGPEAENIPDYANTDLKDIPDSSVHYTVETGLTLNNYNPDLFQHHFVGWSTDDGFLINKVPVGTTGNIEVHANWTSNRNKADSYESYGDPIIIEDDKRGQLLFVYNIGKIENVPLNDGDYLGYFEKLDATMEYETHTYMDKEDTERINEMISLATTQSSGWTLSKEWNEIYGKTEETGTLLEKTKERTNTQGNTVGGEYFVSNSEGGSSHMSTESGGSWANSSKITTDDSWGLNSSFDANSEMYCDAQLGFKNETTAKAGVELPVKIAKVSAGVENTTTIEAGIQNGRKDAFAFHTDSSESHYIGTVNAAETSGYYNSALSESSNWNSTAGYTISNTLHSEEKVTSALKDQIRENTSLKVEKSTGGSVKETVSKSNTNTSESEYGTSVSIKQGTAETTKLSKHLIGTNEGHYRMVPMGTFHVFGVVGYDIASGSYYTHCYNVQDDAVSVQLDYSRDRATFDDCQNGEVNFEIPYEVSEYVAGFVGKTNGLEISYNGVVEDFEPSYVGLADGSKKEFDGTIVVPMYDGKDDLNGKYTAVKVTSFTENTFKKVKDTVETIVLPIYITKIPDNAFKDFKKLKNVIAYGVTEIGENAFAGCESLEKFYVDTAITSLGENAFKDVGEISVAAYDAAVAEAAIKSGAKRITVNISYLKDSFDNKSVKIIRDDDKGIKTEYFALIGKSNSGKGFVYNNLRIDSAADETMINGITFANNTDTPLKLASEKVTLAKVAVDNSPGFAMILTGDDVDVKLLDTVTLNTKGDVAVLSKNVTLGKALQGTSGKIETNKKFLTCGTVTNWETYLNVTPTVITANEYQTYLESCLVKFEPNGGEVSVTEKRVYYGQNYGELPVPTREGYTFVGWYTEKSGGVNVTADTSLNVLGNQTLYAQWSIMSYKQTWNGGIGYSVTVERIASPLAGKLLRELIIEDKVYHGDVLKITYTANPGYRITNNGSTTITVTGDVTASHIYATATPNEYTYNIVFKSSNGTELGRTTASATYGTTHTISPPGKSGYNTPGSQNVKWDSTSPKTITFIYTPTSTSNATKSGYISNDPYYKLSYSANVEYQNRTANSVQLRVVWTTALSGVDVYNSYSQRFNASVGNVSTGAVMITNYGDWRAASSSTRTATAASGWITVPLNTTNATTVNMGIYYYQANANGSDITPTYATNMSTSWTINVPAY